MARAKLESSQRKMKTWYDRQFKPMESVLVLLPIAGQPLNARYCGPYVVRERVGETDYVIDTPDRRKARRLCHVNMLKATVESVESKHVKQGPDVKLNNSEVLRNLDSKLAELRTEILLNNDILKQSNSVWTSP